MELLLHFGGIVNIAYILKTMNKRKFFCVCDKITIGSRTPQCVLGILAHGLSMALLFVPYPGLAFYPSSLWLYSLFYTGIYTYKGLKEICFGCFIAFILSAGLSFLSICQLPYIPWILLLIYSSIFLLSICLTSYSLKAHSL